MSKAAANSILEAKVAAEQSQIDKMDHVKKDMPRGIVKTTISSQKTEKVKSNSQKKKDLKVFKQLKHHETKLRQIKDKLKQKEKILEKEHPHKASKIFKITHVQKVVNNALMKEKKELSTIKPTRTVNSVVKIDNREQIRDIKAQILKVKK